MNNMFDDCPIAQEFKCKKKRLKKIKKD